MHKLIREYNASAGANEKVYFATYYSIHNVMPIIKRINPSITPDEVVEWMQDVDNDIQAAMWQYMYGIVKSAIEEKFADRNPRFEIEESDYKVTMHNGQRRPYFYIVDTKGDYNVVATGIPDRTTAEKIAAHFEESYHPHNTED